MFKSFLGETIRVDVHQADESTAVVSVDLFSGTPTLISNEIWGSVRAAELHFKHLCDAYTFVGFDPVEES